MSVYRLLIWICFVLLLYPTLIWSQTAEELTQFDERVWTDNTGKNTTVATLVEVQDDVVVLKKQNGVEIRVPLSRLSQVDLDYLARIESEKAKAEKANDKSKPAVDSGSTSLSNTSEPAPAAMKKPAEPRTDPQPVTIKLDATHFDGSDSPPTPWTIAAVRATEAATDPPPAQSQDAENQDDPVLTLPMEMPVSEDDLAALPDELATHCRTIVDSSVPRDVRMALERIKNEWPKSNRQVVLQVVRNATFSNDVISRTKAMEILAAQDPKGCLPFAIAKLDDSSLDVRWVALSYLGEARDPASIPYLVAHFDSPDCSRVSLILESFGSAVEGDLVPVLKATNPKVRLQVCQLLGQIGTEKSVPVLSDVQETDGNVIVKLQARSALAKIRQREKTDD